VPASILGIAYHLPARVETNDDLQRANPDWDVPRIAEKSGIRERHLAAPDETAGDLGFLAAEKLLSRNLVATQEIDAILLCTQSPDHFLPTTACSLQHRLKLGKHVAALDFNLGCSGFVYGLYMARCFIESGGARNVLLITAETYSKFLHPHDRTVRTLFGDGAAATLIGSTAEAGIGEFVLGTDGAGAGSLIVPAGGMRLPRSAATAAETTDDAGCVRSADNLFMDGPAIFTFAITVVPRTVKALLEKSGLAPESIDWYAYHQANKYMLDSLAQRSKVPPEKMMLAYEDIGNTVSSSIPIAIQRYVEAGRVRPGQRIMMIGFGVGYSWGACVVTWR